MLPPSLMASFHWTFSYLCNFQSLKDPSAVCIGPPFSQPFIVSPFHCCIFVLFFQTCIFDIFVILCFHFFNLWRILVQFPLGLQSVNYVCLLLFDFAFLLFQTFEFLIFFCNFVFSIFEGSKCSLHWASVGFTAALSSQGTSNSAGKRPG